MSRKLLHNRQSRPLRIDVENVRVERANKSAMRTRLSEQDDLRTLLYLESGQVFAKVTFRCYRVGDFGLMIQKC